MRADFTRSSALRRNKPARPKRPLAKKNGRSTLVRGTKESVQRIKNGQALRPRAATRLIAARSVAKTPPPSAGTAKNGHAVPVQQPIEPRLSVERGNAGDHHAVLQFLTAVFRAPSRDAFLASLDDPMYEPCDRIVVRSGSRIVAHAQITKRVMHFGPLELPVSPLVGMGTLPEYRGQGYGRRVLAEAEREMLADGALLGLLRTQAPRFYRASGWAVCGKHSYSEARTRDIAAELVALPAAETPLERPLGIRIRPWRQVELPALMRLYAQFCNRTPGAIQRSEAYWRWLISCNRFDQIYVAVNGPDPQELDDQRSPIVGYAIMREHQVLELVGHQAHPQSSEQLLARAASEAIERDLHSVVLHAPPGDGLHTLFRQAGGTHVLHESQGGEVFMVKLLDRLKLLRNLCPVFHERAAASSLARPCELAFAVGDERYRLMASRRSVQVASHGLGRSYLRISDADFTRLVLGQLDLDEAISSGRVEPSTRLATDIARVLFPRVGLWRSPLDEPPV